MEKLLCAALSSGNLPAISPPHTLPDCERYLRLEELLPGIQNHITLDNIASKLSWKDIFVLSSVSRGWHHAIKNGHLYDGRVRSQTRETLALIYAHCGGYSSDLTLYSTRDHSCYQLLPNPSDRNEGIRPFSQCVAGDGKVYVLGGYKSDQVNVYMLDLARQRQWTQCASMTQPRSRLKCSVINGKIFAFGFSDKDLLSWGGEVYDPKENTWSPIKTMPMETMSRIVLQEFHTVEPLGHELFYCGYTVMSFYAGRSRRPQCAVYDPVKDEWRDFNHFDRENEFPFVVHGRLHSLSTSAIYVHDVDNHSWRQLHTFPLAGEGDIGMDGYILCPFFAKAVEDELLVLMQKVCMFDTSPGVSLFQSKGFGGDKEEIWWEKVPVEFPGKHFESSPISLLEL